MTSRTTRRFPLVLALGKLVKHLLLIAVAAGMLYPLAWMVSASLRPQSEIFSASGLWPSVPSLEAYSRGWNALRTSFGTFFLNSLLISGLSIFGNLASCSLAAFAFARLEFAGKHILFGAMLATLMLPYQVTLVPQYAMFHWFGWVNTFLPLVVPKFLASDAFFIFLMVQFFRGIPRELDEAARVDGCSTWGIYFRILLPLSTPVLVTSAIFTFIWTWDDFFGPLIYLTDIKTYTVQLALRTFVDSTAESDWGGLFAMSVLSLVPVLLFFSVFQRLIVDGIATTGLKR